ncbi:MAG: hypothetical protein JRI34_13735 [Deltaproteobacteria bacterium]|nr:hypothetical protein [Deltaproteobacteria bacterium]
MQPTIRKYKIVAKLLFLLVLTAVFIFGAPLKAHSQKVYLNVLTINLLFSEIEDRDERLDTIARFVADYWEPIDLILLQEVVGGRLAGTINSALDLTSKLAAKGVSYQLSYRMANGIPRILTVGNAVLSRHPILFTISSTLPFVSEEIFEGIEIPLKRKIMMSRIKIPNFGKINVYNRAHVKFYSKGRVLFPQEPSSDTWRRFQRGIRIRGIQPDRLGTRFYRHVRSVKLS